MTSPSAQQPPPEQEQEYPGRDATMAESADASASVARQSRYA